MIYMLQPIPISSDKTLEFNPPREGMTLFHAQVLRETLWLIWYDSEWPEAIPAEMARSVQEVPWGG